MNKKKSFAAVFSRAQNLRAFNRFSLLNALVPAFSLFTQYSRVLSAKLIIFCCSPEPAPLPACSARENGSLIILIILQV